MSSTAEQADDAWIDAWNAVKGRFYTSRVGRFFTTEEELLIIPGLMQFEYDLAQALIVYEGMRTELEAAREEIARLKGVQHAG